MNPGLEVDPARRHRGRRRGVSGLGLLLVVIGLFGTAVAYSALPAFLFRLWPVILIAVGVFGLLRRPGWVQELDLHLGPEISRTVERPRRIFSWFIFLVGVVCLLFSLQVIDGRVIGPALLVALGVLLVWRRAR
ncbi:MAG: LiaF transmembrane domain-containing protein [Candidatus Dormibacteraceae bacterium]